MNLTSMKKSFLGGFIGFLSFTALVAIIAVIGGEFGEIQVKILISTFSISAASILSMACAAFMEKGKLRELGIVGIVSAGTAALAMIWGVWTETGGEIYWKGTVSLIVFSAALAHALLLLLPKFEKSLQWIQIVACSSIGILALMIMAAVWGEIEDESYYRILAVASIIVVLFTLVIPILMRMKKGTKEVAPRLILYRKEDGTYFDDEDVTYQVKIIETHST